MTFPNLAGVATKDLVENIGTGKFKASYINWSRTMWLKGKSSNESVSTLLLSMGLEYPGFFDLNVVAGRHLRQGDDPWSTGEVLINEKYAELLGFEKPQDAVGAKITNWFTDNDLEVVGVLENYHQTSLHDDYQPITCILSSWTEYYLVKLHVPGDLPAKDRIDHYQNLVENIGSKWEGAFSDLQFDYFFLDQFFNRQYQADEQFGKIFTSFSVLAILIACLGLFGLTSFTLQQRTKEIGIRKVLGADFASLSMLLSKSYLITIVVAYVLAMPLAWAGMSRWLENYTFRVDLGAWLLVIPLAIVLIVSVLTIISRLVRSLKTNPVDSLRYE